MLINGVDLSSLGVQLYDRIITSNIIDTTQDWLEGDVQPTYIRQQDRFKNVTLKFLVTESDENAAFMIMSKLTMLLKKATIKFDDLDLLFDVTINGKTSQDRLKNGNFILTVPLLSDYAKGQTEVYTTDARATNNFTLTILYYMDGNILLGTEKALIKASQFTGDVAADWAGLGIDVNRYQPDYYKDGTITNLGNRELTYENLYALQTIIINYDPVVYQKEVEYLVSVNGFYSPVATTYVSYTKRQVDNASTIGQVINLLYNKPDGYRATTNFGTEFNFANFNAVSSIQVYFDPIENERMKNITIYYYKEKSDGQTGYEVLDNRVVLVKESEIVDGRTLRDFISLNAFKPEKYYENGVCTEDIDALITYDTLLDTYRVNYDLTENLIQAEYYLGTYPGWSRASTSVYRIKYQDSYDEAADIIAAVGINLDKHYTATYNHGVVYNGSSVEDFDSLISLGVLQVYYSPIDYTIRVSYNQEEEPLGYQDFTINDFMFLSNPTLGEVISINEMKPEGYIFDPTQSYDGDVTLAALTAASPIIITYVPVAQVRTKSIVIKYKQELSSAYSTLNTSVITIEESEVGGGIRLSDLININQYRPEYYNTGIIDGYSSASVVLFDEIQGNYDVLYLAGTYNTQIRYYTDEVDNQNWIGSSTISYRVIDFEVGTTLEDLGLNVNAFKPSYCDNGEVQYTGPVTFNALRVLDAIDIVYTAIEEPDDPSGIDYPHRILFLQHNDMGDYEANFPTWTLNHAYINTGVMVPDMSKLTVLCDTFRVFDTEPLYNVNVNDAYLFGSVTPNGSYYIKYVNNTSYKPESVITGVNTFNVMAGNGTPELIIEETSGEGFSANTGITASTREGYSYATLTYTNLIQSNTASMNVPLYLFACNYNGAYRGGIAGVGIKSCKIYYENTLIRDFIPVAFYDKIGDKVSPSNCLYDKISQTFFEDARGLNSFNIMDDEDYVDTNPEHKLGCCYVNYYQDDTLFNTATIWFRGSDFVDNQFDPYEKFFVDYYQPQYYGSGEITTPLGDITFNNLKNKVINIVYHSTGYNVIVNYYQDEVDENNFLGQEVITLTEKDFLQVPTFGDIIPLHKYKPDGYRTVYTYPESKVTLQRLLDHSPYNIVYEEVEDPQEYTTTIKYYKKTFGIDIQHPLNAYTLVGTETITIDETEFDEGIYIEDFIDMDAYYPISPSAEHPYYSLGEPWEWYLKDEMLDDPTKLKQEYVVVYEPVPVYLNIDYYTDVVEEDNLIASTTWKVQVDDWETGATFTIVDELPNNYVDRYKPVICGGGQIQNPSTVYTFDTLVAQGHIDIVYETLEEPHDPDSTMFPSKVIWYDANDLKYQSHVYNGVVPKWRTQHPSGLMSDSGFPENKRYQEQYFGTRIPYLDLGYTPKEIGRLRMETKAYSNVDSMQINYSTYGVQADSFTYFLGYYGAFDTVIANSKRGVTNKAFITAVNNSAGEMDETAWSAFSPNSAGWFAFQGHWARGGSWVYTNAGPQSVDGHAASRADQGGAGNIVWNFGYDAETIKELTGGFRRGYFVTKGNNWENINTYKDYYYRDFHFGHSLIYPYASTVDDNNAERGVALTPNYAWDDVDYKYYYGYPGSECIVFNPTTMTIDAYHDYVEKYDYKNSQNPDYVNLVNTDIDIFSRRAKPVGSITAFATRNPSNGNVNLSPFRTMEIPGLGQGLYGGGAMLGGVAMQNPYSDNFSASVSFTQQVITGTMQDGTPIYENVTVTRSIQYASYEVLAYPAPVRTAIWYIKIWDRDRLVRDLIPVAQGDIIYDYVAAANGMFDKVTETFFYNQNTGGNYQQPRYHNGRIIGYNEYSLESEDILQFHVSPDPTVYGNIVVNYYDENNNFLGNQYVEIPVHYKEANQTIYEICHYNDFKPSEFHHDGMIDIDLDFTHPDDTTLHSIYTAGAINIYYKLKTFTKTVVYYRGNSRIGSKDIFYTIQDIEDAHTLADLGIDVDLYASEDYKPGRIYFNEQILADSDIQTFIDAASPIVVYDEYTKVEKPDLLYLNYYRGGAYDNTLITPDQDPNYLDCDLDGVVLNPHGAIKYVNHYHTALYEDEEQDYFIAYQVDVVANYVPVHKGPARRYSTLAEIVDKGRYTIVEERDGWGRLREYHNGWIMLSYTQKVYGPGQNPDFESPNEDQVIIPFGDEITITKLTIDRLWCYSPEVASWIKAEDISFNQSGRLYNGLANAVIHLDEIDWSNVSSLADIDIFPQAYKLKYHNNSSYTYSGEYTYAAFSDIHSIDFVYPETIYTYNVIYYKDTVEEKHVGDIKDYGIAELKLRDNPGLGVVNVYEEKDTNANYVASVNNSFNLNARPKIFILSDPSQDPWTKASVNGALGWVESNWIYNVIQLPTYITAEEAVSTEIDRDTFSCSVSEWNPDWDTFIATSWQYDEHGYEINPTLYRDTELTLTWDYFGIDKNAYKPQVGNYDDGIFLWNPRSYDNSDVYFTFEELITTGVQKILYVHTLQNYKLVTAANGNPYAEVLLEFNLIPGKQNTVNGIWDIEWKQGGMLQSGPTFYSGSYGVKPYIIEGGRINTLWLRNGGGTSGTTYSGGSLGGASSLPLDATRPYTITNISNKRNVTQVYAWGNDVTGYQSPFYGVYRTGGKGLSSEIGSDQILGKTVNMKQEEFNQLRRAKYLSDIYDGYMDWQTENIGPGGHVPSLNISYQWTDWDGTAKYSHPYMIDQYNYYTFPQNDIFLSGFLHSMVGPIMIWGNTQHPFYYLKVWKNYFLEHYYVPVARGAWLEDGRQVPYNTVYDIITNTIVPILDTDAAYNNQVYTIGDAITASQVYSPFDNWQYDYDTCNLAVQATTNVQRYKYPDELSVKQTVHPQDMIIPAFRVTEDSTHNVIGRWYFDGIGWYKASDVTVLPTGDFTITPFAQPKLIASKGDTVDTIVEYQAFLNPNTGATTASKTFVADVVCGMYAECGDYYWDKERGWIPKAYTEDNYTTIDIDYVVSIDRLKVYQYPIRNSSSQDNYQIDQFLSGDRIHAIKKLVKDENWQYIEDAGWIRVQDSVQELIS